MDQFISTWMKQAADEMAVSAESGALSLAPLKRFQRKIEKSLDLDLNKEDQFLVFFLSSLIQDLFYNFSGDVPYSRAVEDEKQKVFRGLLINLKDFAQKLEEGSTQRMEACSELVHTYLTGIDAVNATLTKEAH